MEDLFGVRLEEVGEMSGKWVPKGAYSLKYGIIGCWLKKIGKCLIE